MEQNYTLGKGMLYLARFLPNTRTVDKNGYRPIGNVPEFNITVETENLDHYSSMGGTREKDASVPLETNRSSSIVTDNLHPDNLALFFFGEALEVVQSAVTGLSETFTEVKRGNSYFLGVTPTTPAGLRGIDMTGTPPVVKLSGDGGASGVAGIDYILDGSTGRLEILASSTVFAEKASITVTYGLAAVKRQRVASGSEPVEGAVRYIANNPEGSDFDYLMGYVRVSPNGDLAVISEEWASIPLSLEILKLPGREAVYIDGRPYI